jgi:hypothetical protein
MRALALLALVLGGCAQNAIFELHVTLPALHSDTPVAGTRYAPVGARFARLQVLPGTALFTEDRLQWITPAVPLTSVEQTTMVTATAEGDRIGQALHVKVQLCADADCSPPVDQRWYAFERTFYQGHYTCYARDFAGDLADAAMSTPTADADAIDVMRCAVGGCVAGTEIDANNCSSDGRHFCESGGATHAQACDLLRDRDVEM